MCEVTVRLTISIRICAFCKGKYVQGIRLFTFKQSDCHFYCRCLSSFSSCCLFLIRSPFGWFSLCLCLCIVWRRKFCTMWHIFPIALTMPFTCIWGEFPNIESLWFSMCLFKRYLLWEISLATTQTQFYIYIHIFTQAYKRKCDITCHMFCARHLHS